jgi:hypothetical protein
MREQDLKVGDLVTHVLYGRKWMGVIIDFREEVVGTDDKRKIKALVQIQPGTKYDGFFERCLAVDRVNYNLGYVSVHWLFMAVEKNDKLGSSRKKTPAC